MNEAIERHYTTSHEAWQSLNKEMINPPNNSNIYVMSNQVIYYNILVKIERSWIEPLWDFTKTVNYTQSKMSSLVSNYIDQDHLEEVLALVYHRELKKNRNYNISFHFANTHGAHGCLLTATFSRRYNQDYPVLQAVMRASEFYKRGYPDLVMLHRLGQKAWGEDAVFGLEIHAHQMWGGAEWLAMLTSVIPPEELFEEPLSDFGRRVKERYLYFKNLKNIDSLSYNAYKRAARVIQGKVKDKRVLAKDLII